MVDPFFERILDGFPNHRNLMFVDSTASLERINLPVFIFWIATPFGALPICVVITADETTETLTEAFAQVKKMGISPETIMTDDATSLKTAIRQVWHDCNQFLCSWHYEQAYWTWLMDTKHGVSKERRQNAINLIGKLIFEREKEKIPSLVDEIKENYNDCEKFIKKINKEILRIKEWNHSYRSNLKQQFWPYLDF